MSSISRQVTIVGHPFIPLGMGEHLRSLYRALKSVGCCPAVWDVYGTTNPDAQLHQEFAGCLSQQLTGVNVFCLNGDEVEPCLRQMQTALPSDSLNIIYPAWELSRYPQHWATQLNRFDEIWAASEFTSRAFQASASKPVIHLPLPGEVLLSKLVGRRHFGIPEDAFVFLFFFDFSSYIHRKNPSAVIEAFREIQDKRPNHNACLVIKVKGSEREQPLYQQLLQDLGRVQGRVVVIERMLDDSEIKSLLYLSDCFVSLHRTEGFGFGLIWAMYLGKVVIGTGYSGNMDYMNELNSCIVPFSLKKVGRGEYPFYEDQDWAEPDVTAAATFMSALLDMPENGRKIGEIASRHIRTHFSYRACGLRYHKRLQSSP